MKKVVVLATFLAATYAPAAFATAELKLTSGASSVDIIDGTGSDVCGTADCVTFSGILGSWKINVTTGLQDGIPFFDLNSVNSTGTGTQVDPILLSFSNDGLALPPQFILSAGGTVSTTKVGLETISFNAYTDTVKFGTAHSVGSLTFHSSPFSGTGALTNAGAGDTAVTLNAWIDLTKGGKGTVSFDAALDSVPEPASVTMLGGVLLILGGALRRRIKKS